MLYTINLTGLKILILPKRSLYVTNNLLINLTQVLFAEPLKKKKKMDPAIVYQREAKKRKKLEKEVKKLELKGRILKPVEEIEPDRYLLKSIDKRLREMPAISEDERESRTLLLKEWTKYKQKQNAEQDRIMARAVQLQAEALNELRLESEELYQHAIQIDEKLIPFIRKGPVETPPIKDYSPPDGDYIDTTKKYDKR